MTEKYGRQKPLFSNKKVSLPHKNQLRQLTQYRDLSEDEFEEIWEKKATGALTNSEFENRIERKIKEFAVDYDLDDLKANDKLTLRALAQSYISLEDIENWSYQKRNEELTVDTILTLEKLNNIMSGLRRDISSMQNDLKITRRIRKGDKEESVINYLEDLKLKAKKFYESKMGYIWCPECKMLLATTWFLYPKLKNKVFLKCGRCKHSFTISSGKLLENKNINIDDVPEYYK